MQALASARWQADGPYVDQHVGDIAWGANPPVGEASAVFLDGGYAMVHDAEWSLGGRDSALPALVAAAAEAGGHVYALSAEVAKVAALRSAGFVPTEEHALWHLVHDLADLRPVTRPIVTGESDVEARFALHRASWVGTRSTPEVYERVRATPPYDPAFDVAALTPEGEWAAYTIGWYDAPSRSGELEPVGTAVAFRRQGYGAATCLAALHRMRDAGARTVVVYAVDDPANPGPRALYESVGFRVADRHVRYLPPSRQNAATPQGGNA
jgi:ribosomal protein S18 acetylase RimI-like enzyme